jgi:glycine cleavage system H protein
MRILEGLKYSKEHEWVKVEGDRAYVGITDFAQKSLGSIVFVELPKVGASFKNGDVLGVVESVKAASDIYLPLSGEVVEVNEALEETPEKINEVPFESWFVVICINNPTELDQLMDEKQYELFCNEGG